MERIEKYRSKGLKLTPQRLAILEYLDGNTSHPTAEDIYRAVKKKHPTISFATVYNTLQALLEMGEVMELTIDPERKHFDPNTTPHHHIVCTRCGKIGDVFVDYSSALELPPEVTEEFTPISNHIDFYGVCKKCNKTKRRTK
ncbi:MAG TPA: transcriptional repressor [Deltaproteobacteria bacterium]|nr:transcriptional repressor [Deltaproteobacteria bacterium]